MNKQDFMKLQTCVLRVNIQCACEGCKQKIKKLLNKVDGVYKTSIDLDQGKVTVSGNADPATLIQKLNKSGKHAELWGPPKGVNVVNNQFKNMVIDNKGQKGGQGGGGGGGGGLKDKQKDGKGHDQQVQSAMNKEFKDIKMPNKDQKSVKISLPGGGGSGGGRFDDEDDFDDDDSFDDEDDEFDDEFDDEDDDSFDGYEKKQNKMTTGPGVRGHGPHGPVGIMNGNGKKGGPGETGFAIPVQFLAKAGNNDAKNGKKGGESKDGGKKSKDGGGGGGFGGFFGGKFGGAFLGGGKKKQSESSPKGGENGGDGRKNGGGWDKKGAGKHQDEGKINGGKKHVEFLDFTKPQNGGGGGGGRNMGQNGVASGGGRSINPGGDGGNPMMPQMGGYPMSNQMTGYPPGNQMGGYPSGNQMGQMQQQFQQQQYQQQYAQAMMMNQQRANMYPQMMYGQPPVAAYGPPMGSQGNDNISHMFSDENTDSCSIM